MSMLDPARARSGIHCVLPTLIATVSAEPPLCVKENIKYNIDMVYFMQLMPMYITHNYKMFLSYREGDMKKITIFEVVFTVKSTATFIHLSTALTTKESSLHSEAHFCSNYSIIEGKKHSICFLAFYLVHLPHNKSKECPFTLATGHFISFHSK